jgi:hypothetical protein
MGNRINATSEKYHFRSPPPLPIQAIENASIGTLRFPVYLRCTLQQDNRVLTPCPGHVGFELFLSLPHPCRIVLLRDAHVAVAKQDAHAIERHPGLQQRDGERIAEPVRMSAVHASQLEQVSRDDAGPAGLSACRGARLLSLFSHGSTIESH